jgi:phage-related protein
VAEKPVRWVGSSLEDVRAFPDDARREAGYQLGRVQQGMMPSDWKPMGSVGLGVYEIRIHTGTEQRVFYGAKFREAVYVLHAFQKRSRRTPQPEIDVARKRLADLSHARSADRGAL